MERTILHRYARNGNGMGHVAYLSAMHAEELDGTDELTVRTRADLSKGDRLVWQDETGRWHEHIVDSIERARGGGRPVTEATCINSFAETHGILCQGTKLTGTVAALLSAMLNGTRWLTGSCDVTGSFTVETWHKSVHEAVSDLVAECGGEFETVIAVNDAGVVSRTARIVSARGRSTIARQFAYGRNMTDVTKSVGSDDPVTAVMAYGAKLDETSTDDYAERLSVTVTDASLIPAYGTPGPDGTLGHTWAVYTDDACDDAAFLFEQAHRTLRNLSQPDVEYVYDLTGIDGAGRLSIGDAVSVVDDEFGVPVANRITRIERDLAGKTSGSVRIGKRRDVLVEQYKATERTTMQTTGNKSAVASSAPVITNGNYGGSGSGGGGGDSHHYLDGVQYDGNVNFVTVQPNT